MAEAKARIDPPRPLREAWPFLAFSLSAFALAAAPRVPWLVAVTAGGLFLLAAFVRVVQAYLKLRWLRESADRLILSTSRSSLSPLAEWRAGELANPASHRRIVRPLRRLVRSLEGSSLPGASPVNRVVAREHLDALRQLAVRLDNDRPVSARALLLLHQFLTSPDSPLYAREHPDAFAHEVDVIQRELGANDAPRELVPDLLAKLPRHDQAAAPRALSSKEPDHP
jgi:hypothetical protein